MRVLSAIASLLLSSSALSASFEPVAQPCRAKNVLAGCAVKDRETGRDQFVISNSSEEAGLELIFIDIEANTSRIFRAPAGQGSWCIREVPGDRLVVSTYYDGKFLVFDLNAMKFTQTADVPGESYIWNVTMGSDGRVYGGTYPGAKLAAMDLDTYAVEVCGAPAPPNMYLRNVGSTEDGRIICKFGMEAPATLVYDPAAKEFSPVTDADKERTDAVTAPAGVDLRGGRVLAADSQGRLMGIRGQDYFVLKPGETKLDLRPIPAETAPRPLMFLLSGQNGRLWGGPHFGQTLCWLDPATKEFHNTPCVCDSGGEIFDVAFGEECLFAAAYAGGDIIRYCPKEPWDQWNNKNPRRLVHLTSRGYIRPVGGIQLAPDGKLYAGWMGKYGSYSGAISITDPESGETELIENPLGEKTVSGLYVDETRIYAGTSLAANGLPAKPDDTPSFGVFDVQTREKLYEHVFEGVKEVRIFGKSGDIVIVAAPSKIHCFDSAGMGWVSGLPENLPRLNSYNAVLRGPILWYGSGNSLVRLDLQTWEFTKLAETPDKLRNVAMTPGGGVFVSSGSTVYRLTEER